MEISIKEGMPSLNDAMELLKSSVKNAKPNKIRTLEIIHGYGSSGIGGIIGKKAREWLKAQENTGKVKTVIFGEDFDMFDEKSRNLHTKYLELNIHYGKGNNGITIVEI